MSIDAFQHREELLKLRAKLDAAEQLRLSRVRAFSLEEVFWEVENIYCGTEKV